MQINQIYSLVLMIFSLINIFLCVFLIKKGKNHVKKSVVFLIISITIYTLGYSIELLQFQLRYVKWLIYFEYLGTLGMTYFWADVFLDMRGKNDYRNRPFKIVLGCIAIGLYLAVITNDFHHLFYINMKMVPQAGFFVVDFERGPIYIVQDAYNLFVILGGTAVSFFMINRSQGILKKQYMFLLGCSFMAWVSMFISIARVSPFKMDNNPIFAAPIAMIFGYVAYKYRLTDVMPLAHYHVFQQINDPVLVLDNNRLIVGYNKAFNDLVPEVNEKHIGVRTLAFKRYAEDLRHIIDYLNEENLRFNLYSSVLKKHMHIKVSHLVEDGDKIGEIFLISEITREVEQLESLEKLANLDSLTEIYNRRKYFEKGNNLIKNSELTQEYVSAVTFDIDDFKKINDQYGHSAGDVVLKGIGEILQDISSESCIVGRIGGEEFGLIIKEHNIKSAAVFCEKLKRKIVDKKYNIDGVEVSVTASFGIAEFNRVDNDSFDKLITRSDKAMYKAKVNGKNRVEYFKTLAEEKKVAENFYHLFKG